MILRAAASLAILTFTATTGFSETINLRNSCEPWEHIPQNEALGTPASGLLQCADDDGIWLAVQIMCFTETAELEFRYRPRHPINAPIKSEPEVQETSEVITLANGVTINIEDLTLPKNTEIEPIESSLADMEMLFFNFPKIGVTSVVNYDYEAKDWSYRDKEPLGPLFRNFIAGNYADVSLIATGITERLPLKGSTKALRPVVEACRIAKRKVEAAKKLVQD
ncbi:hypothetical protein F9L33_02730 [Amylibacter sp. SFDW26]|uniref:hypothetical protein n=1 Tax=Amylibacter sp. SFDW26 TaxID=2652722 RepID=UPI001261B596|nr:hypothetical protein [Amylibacter sp. SFDW26]KAB7615695.1 hypothetical protein F9L33_02730 [Amylibacter sp. SFDW26]